jgi:hypothetical protein
MTTDSVRMPPDPRRFGDGAHPWLKLPAPELRATLREACAQQRDADIAAALNSAPSPAAYASLWSALCDAVHQAAGDHAEGALMARIFALPLIVVTGSRKRIQIDGALPDIATVKEMFLQKGILGKTQNFGLGNALCSLETLESLRPAEVFAWTQAGGAARRELPPQPLVMEEPGERVHLRFLVGAGIAPANEPALTETASNIGAWGMALTQLLTKQLAQPGAEVLPMARPPADLLRAGHIGRTAQLETACNLFASNAVRRFRQASGDPVAIISAHDNGELRLTLSQPFDEQMVEGFRWPLHPLDDLAAIIAAMSELLSACRVQRIEIAPRVLPDCKSAGMAWFPTLREWPQLGGH